MKNQISFLLRVEYMYLNNNDEGRMIVKLKFPERSTMSTISVQEGQEGYDVEYKRSTSDLESKDFVTFASSDDGGNYPNWRR